MAEVLDCRIGGFMAAKIIKVPYRTLDNWIRTGLIPVTRPARGEGTRREFSFLDLIRARCVIHLREKGVSLQAIRKVRDELTERYGVEDPLVQTAKLVVADEKVFWITDDGSLLHVLKGQYAAPVVFLDVPEMVRDTARRMAEVCEVVAA